MLLTDLLDAWAGQLLEWVTAFIAGLPQMLAAIAVLGFFWYASKWAQQAAVKLFDHVDAPVSMERLLIVLVKIAVMLFGIVIALGILNLDKTVTSMLAGLGIVGVALGFAFQDIVANFIAGIILVIRRPFKIGEVISVAGQMGVVELIELRSTIIRSFQGQIIHIPNQKVFSDVIVNYSELGKQRIDLACGVSYDDDLESLQYETVQAIQGLGYSNDDLAPVVHFETFGDSAINFKVRFWIDYNMQSDFLLAQSEAIKVLTKIYREKGFTIPYPVTAIDLKQQKAGEVLKG